MTRKFWDNWQKRCGETKIINFTTFDHPSFRGNRLDVKYHKFKDFKFTPDYVTIKFFDTVSKSNKAITLLIDDVKTVKF